MLEPFLIIIDKRKFQSTNGLWNQLQLNSPKRVGLVSSLIESKPFTSKEEWRDFYYESGNRRWKKLQVVEKSTLSKDERSKEVNRINLTHGRTESEIVEIGQELYHAIQTHNNPLSLTLAECVWIAKYRIIGETWNGIVLREKNTIHKLTTLFPRFEFRKTTGDFDYWYAIDYEVFHKKERLLGLQIKPQSYQSSSKKPYIQKAKKANQQKEQKYKNDFGKPVLYLYASKHGDILNTYAIETLSTLYKQKSPDRKGVIC